MLVSVLLESMGGAPTRCRSRSTSALHKHYVLVGERECWRQMRHQHGADALVSVRANQPQGYAKDVEAGCKAAIGF